MNDVAPRVVAPQQAEQDAPESSVRPATLDEFVGQHQLRDNLRVFIEAAKSRGEALDHILFFGPPGSEKRRSRKSSPAKWASTSMPPQAR